jgi:gluconokinase
VRPTSPTTTIVVAGVSGTGKTTVATGLVRRLGWAYLEGDALHSPRSLAKMAAGVPLDDEDRWAWLYAVADWVGDQERAGRDAVATCSALKRSYRDLLRGPHPSVVFSQLVADPAVLRARLLSRRHHFMPAALLDSQLADQELLAPDEPGFVVSVDRPPGQVVAAVLAALGLPDEP